MRTDFDDTLCFRDRVQGAAGGILFDLIAISAGQRGFQTLLALDDYTRVVETKVAAIAKDKE